MTGHGGPALLAHGLQVDSAASLGDSFRITSGDGSLGVVRLLDARIGGQSAFAPSAELAGTDGPAFHADRLQLDGTVFLRDRFTTDVGAAVLAGVRPKTITGG
jgi:hypothetical protein